MRFSSYQLAAASHFSQANETFEVVVLTPLHQPFTCQVSVAAHNDTSVRPPTADLCEVIQIDADLPRLPSAVVGGEKALDEERLDRLQRAK